MKQGAGAAAYRRSLWELVLAYKGKLLGGSVFPIEKREDDRRYLVSISELLESLGDRILDSKAYLGLATMQEEAGRRFLAAGTSPVIRFRMLARVVGSLATPIVHLAGRSTVSLSHLDRPMGESAPDQIEESPAERPPMPEGSVRALSLEKLAVESVRSCAIEKVAAARDLESLSRSLTFAEAEIASQLASGGEITLPVDLLLAGADSPDAIVSFVLKAESSHVDAFELNVKKSHE